MEPGAVAACSLSMKMLAMKMLAMKMQAQLSADRK
jgi:hypothetical protein